MVKGEIFVEKLIDGFISDKVWEVLGFIKNLKYNCLCISALTKGCGFLLLEAKEVGR